MDSVDDWEAWYRTIKYAPRVWVPLPLDFDDIHPDILVDLQKEMVMATYRRNQELNRCQRWTIDGVWVECDFDEPETVKLPADEALVVGPMTDPNAEGPLIIPIKELVAMITGNVKY